MKNHIVLYCPQIPPNTGNIARTCAATNTHLHLIHPLGFEVTDKHLKRAGLDYWHEVQITHHSDFNDFIDYLGDRRLYLITKFAPRVYSQAPLADSTIDEQFFLFGREDKGLPMDFMQTHKSQSLRIPMDDTHVRSLNLANTVNIVLYEALRQQNFATLEMVHHYDDTDKARQLNW